MKRANWITVVGAAAVAALGMLAAAARAEEGGSGHYAPGAAASFVDALPGKPGWAVASYSMYYTGSAGATRALPIGGQVTFGLKAKAYAETVLALYQTPLKLLGGDCAFGIAVPFLRMDADGSITGPLGNTIAVNDSASGLGDVILYPFMLGWVKGDLKYDVRLGVYAPTGAYDKGRLANLGKNYWTLEPTVSVSWLSSKIGTEVSAYAGMDFNTTNDATQYRSGDVLHIDATIAQHLPVGKLGVIGLGANGFFYKQITGDSGAGAVLGDFKGRTEGIGPVLSLITKVGHANLAAELKWLKETSVENRVKGDTYFLKIGVAF
ncbi:MAG: transporter [Acidobacteriia bacterium]|nr:transporter [Terriglobia bacterium]